MKPSFLKFIRSKNSERGQAIVIIVFSLIGILAFSSLAIDGGNALVDRRNAENGASAAALAGALARINGQNWRAAALAAANTNGYNNDGVTNTVELNTPPLSGPNAGNSEYIEVIITSHLRTYFGSVIGINEIVNIGKSVSRSKPAQYGQMFEGFALVSLAPQSNCNNKLSFVIHGEATVSLTGGGIFVNSDNADCAFQEYGSGSIRVQDTSPILVVGGADIQKPKLISPSAAVQTGVAPISYPPAFMMPKVGCGSKIAEVDLTNGSMTPGNWDDGDFPPEGVRELKSGTYCINGDMIVDSGAKLTGNNILLIIEHGNVSISSSAHVDLSAGESGLLIYMPIDKVHKRIALSGDKESRYKGTILAPSADIHLNGPYSRYGFHSQIIGYFIGIDGQALINLQYSDEDNYDAFNMPEVFLSE